MASNCLASCDRIIANFCRSQISLQDWQRYVRRIRSREAADESQFLKRVFSRIIVTIGQRIGQELMARVTHALQIDLRFGHAAGQL
jgi:hypothetical protein